MWSAALFAQGVQFTASASKTRVATGEAFEVSFALNGNGDRFMPPGFNGFEVASGPNVSQSMTSINGNTSTSTGYSYVLVPTREGQYTIGPASIIVNGHTMATRPFNITVVKGSPQQQRQSARGQQQPPPQQSPSDVREARAGDVSKQLFIRAVADKSNVYQGEQFTIGYRLYTRVGILQSQVDKIPDLNGFWSQDIGDPRQPAAWRTETFQNQRYNVANIKQTILFPEHSGNLQVDPLAMTFVARIPAPAKDIMDQFLADHTAMKK
jgi:hypothetical protein